MDENVMIAWIDKARGKKYASTEEGSSGIRSVLTAFEEVHKVKIDTLKCRIL